MLLLSELDDIPPNSQINTIIFLSLDIRIPYPILSLVLALCMPVFSPEKQATDLSDRFSGHHATIRGIIWPAIHLCFEKKRYIRYPCDRLS